MACPRLLGTNGGPKSKTGEEGRAQQVGNIEAKRKLEMAASSERKWWLEGTVPSSLSTKRYRRK